MNPDCGDRRSRHGSLSGRLRRSAATLLVLAAAFCPQMASATLVDQGQTTFDTATGLEWLDMSQSVGISAQSIIAGTDPNNLGDAGWILATVAQITTLATNAGIAEPFDGTLTPSNYPGANLLIALLGRTGQTNLNFIQAFSADAPPSPPGFLQTPVVLASITDCPACFGGADFRPFLIVPADVTNPTIGNWLVRSAPIPEPNALALVALALAGLGVARRR